MKGMECLIKYLTQVQCVLYVACVSGVPQMRYVEQQTLQGERDNPVATPEVIKKRELRLQLIDTTLLKCYIKVRVKQM